MTATVPVIGPYNAWIVWTRLSLEVIKRELAEAKREIESLRMRLKNVEIPYQLELEGKASKKAALLHSRLN